MKTHQDTAKKVDHIQVIRHSQVCQKLQISSAKLFDLVAKGLFPKPFPLIPGGRAVGWLEQEINDWILNQKASSSNDLSKQSQVSGNTRFAESKFQLPRNVNTTEKKIVENMADCRLGGSHDVS